MVAVGHILIGMRALSRALLIAGLVVLANCSQQPEKSDKSDQPVGKYDHIPPELRTGNEGRYAVDDDFHPVLLLNPATIVDAIPKPEPIKKAGNKNPYTVLGKTYHLLPSQKGYKEQGGASWYGLKFHGHKTSNGETYSIYAMTAAHKTLPIPSYVKVTNLANNKQVIVRVNDRGPFHAGRIIDLSYAAATKLDYIDNGTAQVEVEAIDVASFQHPQRPMIQKPEKNYSTVSAVRAAKSSIPLPLTNTNKNKPSAQPNYYVQLGAYSKAKTGYDLITQFQEKLAYPLRLDTSKKGIFRLRVGPILASQVKPAILQAKQLGFNAAHQVKR